MFKIEYQWPLPSKCFLNYRGIAYDGCWFYLTVDSKCKVIQFDECFNEIKCFETCRQYTSICYDPIECCFWASDERCFSTIFKLNECFEEIDRISICIPEISESVITGISFNCAENNLILSFAAGVVCVDKESPRDAQVIIRNRCGWIMGMICVAPYIICYCINGEKRGIRIYNCSGKLLNEMSIDNNWIIESAVFFPCRKKEDNDCHCRKKENKECHFYVLATKHRCYPVILDCIMENSSLCSSICHCNYDICKTKCPGSKPCHKNPCVDILESIALVEASIAHILNAEGEKLQKVLASTDDVCKILEVNQSVNRTMEKAAHLEHLLYNKLEALNACCNCGESSWIEICKEDGCKNFSGCIDDIYPHPCED